jgi:hypothetical protein
MASANNDYDSDVSSDNEMSAANYNSFARALPLFMGFRGLISGLYQPFLI